MAAQPANQISMILRATQEDLQVMLNYAKVLLKENMALHALLQTVVIPYEEDLETLSYLSELNHEVPLLKTVTFKLDHDQRTETNGPQDQPVSSIEQPVSSIEQPVSTIEQPVGTRDQPVSTRGAARLSFWPEAVSSVDEDLRSVLKEKMGLKEEVLCLMEEVEVLKEALKRAGSELNSLKSERASREDVGVANILSTVTERGVANVPSMVTEGGVANIPSTVTEGGVANIPSTVTEGGVANIPSMVTERGVANVPSMVTEGGVANVPSMVTEGGVANVPSTVADVPSPLTAAYMPSAADKSSTGHYLRVPTRPHHAPLMASSTCDPSAALTTPHGIPTKGRCVSAYVDTLPTETTPTKNIASNKSAARSISYRPTVRQTADADSYITAVCVVDLKPQESQDVYMYVIHVTWTDGMYEVYRRYGEFFTFSNALKQLMEADSISLPSLSTLPPLPPLLAVSRPGHPESSRRNHLDAMNTFCEVLAVQVVPKVSRSALVTDFFKAYPRDKNLGRTKAPTLSMLSQKSSTDLEHPTSKDQPAEMSPHQLVVANGDVPVDQSMLHIATEDCVSDGTRRVGLARGDLVAVIEKSEDGWWLVIKGDVMGWAPSTYLELKNPKQDKAHEDLQRRPAGGEYIAERPYAAMFKDELSFPKEAVLHILEKSFDGWWLARYNERVGLVPASLLVKKVGKRVPRKTCVTLRSNFGHTLSGIPEPPPRRLLESGVSDLVSAEEGARENGGVDTNGDVTNNGAGTTNR